METEEGWDGNERRARDRPGRWPLGGSMRGHPYPRLSDLPPERWRAALRETDPSVRNLAVSTAEGGWAEAAEIAGELDSEEGAGHRRRIEAAAFPHRLPTPPGPLEVFSPRRTRQVNMRMSAGEHGELAQAARGMGLRPAQLARQLVLRGVRAIRTQDPV